MLTDAHCHPFDLAAVCGESENERRRLGILCAASAARLREFEYAGELAVKAQVEKAPPVLPCYAIHPQLCALWKKDRIDAAIETRDGLALLAELAASGRLAAIGETGFDLFNRGFRETEKEQDAIFAAHLELALRHDLPLLLHVRRAMHKIFSQTNALKKCRSIIFHSWPGTAGEGEALLKRGINVFFSFGTPIMLNHREAMRCCALFPAGRLLSETDAPYQPLREKPFSRWADLPLVVETMATLRRQAGTECSAAPALEKTIETNFRLAFGVGTP